MIRRLIEKFTGKLDHILNSQAHIFHLSKNVIDRNLLLSGQIACQNVRKMDRIRNLSDVEFRVTSQWGEDGIIEWLCHKIPNIPRSFVEFGVENYMEANTRYLLQNRGWKGLIFDGNDAAMAALKQDPIYWMYDLVAVGAFISAENIDKLISENGFAGDLGILSVDIDGVDYWVLEAIKCVNPAILICEFNGVLGDQHAITVPYDPSFERLKAHHSGQYFGASLTAMTKLAEQKGYTFVGTNTNGVNAFYVRNDLADPVLSSVDEVKSWPPRHRDSRNSHGTLTFVRGEAKAEQIKDLTVHNLATNANQSIESLMPLYSEDWLREM